VNCRGSVGVVAGGIEGAVDSKSGAAGGPWPVFLEKRDSSVVQQFNELAYITACAEMLLKSRDIEIDQRQIFEVANDPTVNSFVAAALNTFSEIC